jgi:hypothetical protein
VATSFTSIITAAAPTSHDDDVDPRPIGIRPLDRRLAGPDIEHIMLVRVPVPIPADMSYALEITEGPEVREVFSICSATDHEAQRLPRRHREQPLDVGSVARTANSGLIIGRASSPPHVEGEIEHSL